MPSKNSGENKDKRELLEALAKKEIEKVKVSSEKGEVKKVEESSEEKKGLNEILDEEREKGSIPLEFMIAQSAEKGEKIKFIEGGLSEETFLPMKRIDIPDRSDKKEEFYSMAGYEEMETQYDLKQASRNLTEVQRDVNPLKKNWAERHVQTAQIASQHKEPERKQSDEYLVQGEQIREGHRDDLTKRHIQEARMYEAER